MTDKLSRSLTGIFVGQGADDGEDGVQTLEHDSVQHHLAQARLDRQVCQVVAQLCQLLPLIQGVHLLHTAQFFHSVFIQHAADSCGKTEFCYSFFLLPYSIQLW